MKTVIMKCVASVAVMALVWSCGVKMPEETHKSYETVTVKKQDITIPLRFSAKMKGTNDVTISAAGSSNFSVSPSGEWSADGDLRT